jgi:helix-turn-helix protein
LIESGRESQIKVSSNLNLKKKLRTLALSSKHKPMILSIIESIENAHDDVQVKTNLIFFLKTVLVNQPLTTFETLFSTTTPKEKLRDMMENSPSDEIKDLFSILYSQIVREYGDKDIKAKKVDEKNELESVDDANAADDFGEDDQSDNSSWDYGSKDGDENT